MDSAVAFLLFGVVMGFALGFLVCVFVLPKSVETLFSPEEGGKRAAPKPRPVVLDALVKERRDVIARRLRVAQKDQALGQSAIVDNLSTTLYQLDAQILPSLKRLLTNHRHLQGQLKSYRENREWSPDPSLVAALEETARRQEITIASAVKAITNIEARTLMLVQGGAVDVEASARNCESAIQGLQQVINEVLALNGGYAQPPASSLLPRGQPSRAGIPVTALTFILKPFRR